MNARQRKLWRKHAFDALRIDHETGQHYLRAGQMPTGIPSGYVLVHNHVKHSTGTKCGVNSFRAWMQLRSREPERLESCDCGWSGLPHYRIKPELLFQPLP